MAYLGVIFDVNNIGISNSHAAKAGSEAYSALEFSKVIQDME